MARVRKVFVLELTEDEIKALKLDLSHVHENSGEEGEPHEPLEPESLTILHALEELL